MLNGRTTSAWNARSTYRHAPAAFRLALIALLMTAILLLMHAAHAHASGEMPEVQQSHQDIYSLNVELQTVKKQVRVVVDGYASESDETPIIRGQSIPVVVTGSGATSPPGGMQTVTTTPTLMELGIANEAIPAGYTRVSGRLVHGDASPLDGAELIFVDEDDDNIRYTITTDDNGAFTADLPSSSYSAKIVLNTYFIDGEIVSAYFLVDHSFDALSGTSVDLGNLVMDSLAEVEGRFIFDGGGLLMSQIWVGASSDSMGYPLIGAHDDSGYFKLLLTPGLYDFGVLNEPLFQDGWVPNISVPAGGLSTVEIEPAPYPLILLGRVTDPIGQGLPATVVILDEKGMAVNSIYTDNGEYTIGWQSADTTFIQFLPDIQVDESGNATGYLSDTYELDTALGAVLKVDDIALEEAVVYSGILTDQGAPATDRTVVVYDSGAEQVIFIGDIDENGKFYVAVPEGDPSSLLLIIEDGSEMVPVSFPVSGTDFGMLDATTGEAVPPEDGGDDWEVGDDPATLTLNLGLYMGSPDTPLAHLLEQRFDQASANALLEGLTVTLKRSPEDVGRTYGYEDGIWIDQGAGTFVVWDADHELSASLLIPNVPRTVTSVEIVGGSLEKVVVTGFNLDSTVDLGETKGILGDYDQDGQVTNADYDLWLDLYRACRQGTANAEQHRLADLSRDGTVDNIDFSVWLLMRDKI